MKAKRKWFPATPDYANQISKTDEPGEAKDKSPLAQTGHTGTTGFSQWGSINRKDEYGT